MKLLATCQPRTRFSALCHVQRAGGGHYTPSGLTANLAWPWRDSSSAETSRFKENDCACRAHASLIPSSELLNLETHKVQMLELARFCLKYSYSGIYNNIII